MPTVAALEKYLVVPVALDALCVPAAGMPAIDPLINPSGLPYAKADTSGRITHFNEGTAYLSESILSQPFSDQNALLEPGIHLHWSLPDALTRAQSKPGEEGQLSLEFPTVPNRWLVMRQSTHPGIPNKCWMVFSDFLWPEDADAATLLANNPGWLPPATAYHHRLPANPGEIPFCYLGLVHTFSPGAAAPVFPAIGKPLDKLTAAGYGDPLFSALYVNCRNVFGMHDDLEGMDPKKVKLRQISYEVVGWYSDPQNDLLFNFVSKYSPDKFGGYDLLEALQNTHQLTLPDNQQSELPANMACRGVVSFVKDQPPAQPLVLNQQTSVELAVGNSATEALSAYLANKIAGDEDERLRIENQLESLYMQAYTEDQFADLGPVFEEARHDKTFHPVSGGRLWALRPETAKEAGEVQLRDFYADLGAALYFLPPDTDDLLDKANALQDRYNKASGGIEFLQRQIFTDWHKYMICCYHEEGRGDYPDIDEVRMQVERLIDLHTLLNAFRGNIFYDKNEKTWAAQPVILAGQLPEPMELLHLIPENMPVFQAWCLRLVREQAKEEPQREAISIEPLAQALAATLNKITAGLAWRVDIVRRMRQMMTILQDEERPLSINALEFIARKVDSWFDKKNEQVQAPQLQVEEALNALKQQLTGSSDLIHEAIDLLKEAINPLAALPVLSLDASKAPRYWQPNEPVLMLAGQLVETTDRHGMDGAGHDQGYLTGFPADKQFVGDVLRTGKLTNDAGFSRQTDGNPWHSLLFEWEVRIDELSEKGNRNPATLSYDPDFITSQFTLSETKSEFLISRQSANTNEGRAYFSGRSVLLPYAQQQLISEIENYLIKHAHQYVSQRFNDGIALTEEEKRLAALVESDPVYRRDWLAYFNTNQANLLAFYDSRHQQAMVSSYFGARVEDLDQNLVTPAEAIRRQALVNDYKADLDAASYWDKKRTQILNWYKERLGQSVQDKDPVHTILQAQKTLAQLESNNIHIQAQALSGFNDALIMLREHYQLEVAEPIGPPAYRNFSAKVAQVIDRHNLVVGDPFLDFHPLRTGKMAIEQLRLVDTFGRVHPLVDLTDNSNDLEIFRPERMKTNDGRIALPPRIVQPARINLRWLAADPNLGEVNTHPLSSPICGWITPSYLDNNLFFYNNSGAALGSLDETGTWRPFPGRESEVLTGSIANPYLLKLRDWLHDQAQKDAGFIRNTVDEWERIVAGIDPAGYSQHQARSLLVGRPMALVQLSVDLQLKSWPAVHQDWTHYRRVMAGAPYHYDGFTKVDIPIRIGEHQRLNDGVVSFWLDTENGYLNDLMYTPLRQLSFNQTIASPPQRISVLMDPRGLLHCTTGILPTKAISIPREQYSEALHRIQVAFLTAPVISDPGHINLPLPQEAGFTWAWLQKEERLWTEFTERLFLIESEVTAAFPDGQEVWFRLLQNGWLEPSPRHEHQGYYVPIPERRLPTLAIPDDDDVSKQRWTDRQPKIQRVIDMLLKGIIPPHEDARFGPAQEIREGWMALRPVTGFEDDLLL